MAINRAVVLLTSFLVALPSFVAANTAWNSLGQAWVTISPIQAYVNGGPAAQFIDALILFFLTFMFVFGAVKSKKINGAVATGAGLIAFIPAVVAVYLSGQLLFSRPSIVLIATVLAILGFYNLLDGAISKPFGKFKERRMGWNIAIIGFAVTITSVFMYPLMEFSIAGSTFEGNIKAASLGILLASGPVSLISAILSLFTVGITGHSGAHNAGVRNQNTFDRSDRLLLGQSKNARKDEAKELQQFDISTEEIKGIIGEMKQQCKALSKYDRQSLITLQDVIKRLDALRRTAKEFDISIDSYKQWLEKGGTKSRIPKQFTARLSDLAASWKKYVEKVLVAVTAYSQRRADEIMFLDKTSRAKNLAKSRSTYTKLDQGLMQHEREVEGEIRHAVGSFAELLENAEKESESEVLIGRLIIHDQWDAIRGTGAKFAGEVQHEIDRAREVMKGLREGLDAVNAHLKVASSGLKEIRGILDKGKNFANALEEPLKQSQESAELGLREFDTSNEFRKAQAELQRAVAEAHYEEERRKEKEAHEARILTALEPVNKILDSSEKEFQEIEEEKRHLLTRATLVALVSHALNSVYACAEEIAASLEALPENGPQKTRDQIHTFIRKAQKEADTAFKSIRIRTQEAEADPLIGQMEQIIFQVIENFFVHAPQEAEQDIQAAQPAMQTLQLEQPAQKLLGPGRMAA